MSNFSQEHFIEPLSKGWGTLVDHQPTREKRIEHHPPRLPEQAALNHAPANVVVQDFHIATTLHQKFLEAPYAL